MGGNKIKHIFTVLIFIVSVMLGGCNLIDSKNTSYINQYTVTHDIFDKIVSALDNKDKEALKSLFSKKALLRTPEIDDEIENIFEMYQGQFVSNSYFTAGSSSTKRREDRYVYLTANPIVRELVTDEAIFYLRYFIIIVDEENPNDVGLWGIWLRTMDGERVTKEVQVGIPYPGRGN